MLNRGKSPSPGRRTLSRDDSFSSVSSFTSSLSRPIESVPASTLKDISYSLQSLVIQLKEKINDAEPPEVTSIDRNKQIHLIDRINQTIDPDEQQQELAEWTDTMNHLLNEIIQQQQALQHLFINIHSEQDKSNKSELLGILITDIQPYNQELQTSIKMLQHNQKQAAYIEIQHHNHTDSITEHVKVRPTWLALQKAKNNYTETSLLTSLHTEEAIASIQASNTSINIIKAQPHVISQHLVVQPTSPPSRNSLTDADDLSFSIPKSTDTFINLNNSPAKTRKKSPRLM